MLREINWWEHWKKNGESLTKKEAKRLLLPATREFRAKYQRWRIEDFIATIILVGGGIFITIESIIGNPPPAWGVEVAAVVIGIMMIFSLILLIGHRVERNTVLNDKKYKILYSAKLKMNGYSID